MISLILVNFRQTIKINKGGGNFGKIFPRGPELTRSALNPFHPEASLQEALAA